MSTIDQYAQPPSLAKAERLGLSVPEDLEALAILRGCRYYDVRNEGDQLREEPRLHISTDEFSNAELAAALLSPALPESLLRQRMGAAMLSARDIDATEVAQLAEAEGCAGLVRYIAECGREVEPDEGFWETLLSKVGEEPHLGKLPHVTRLIAMTGITRNGVETVRQWIRPGEPVRI